MATNIQTRSSVLALKKEVTEGVPVFPTAGTDSIALQDDISVDPAFDELESSELKSSIGMAKTIQGAENPTTSFSHYLRASGIPGVPPNYGLALESFFGAKSVATNEYTVAGSTVSTITVPVGMGVNFERGQMLLIKDAVNGTRVRAVDSVVGDVLHLGFDVPNAATVGTSLGKCVLYKPENSGHPTITVHYHLGNGGALEVVSGCRVTSVSFEAAAGDFINSNYSLEGLTAYFNPIAITATTKFLDFKGDDGTHTAILPVKVFKDPHQLADAIQAAMQGVTTDTITVKYLDASGNFSIAGSGATFELQFLTGANTANTIAPAIGFAVADQIGSPVYYGAPMDFSFPFTPAFDVADPNVAKNMEVMIGDGTDWVCFEASSVSVDGSDTRSALQSLCAESGNSGSIITERSFEMSVTARLSQYDVSMWKKFREGANVKLQMTMGQKVGGNWAPGKVVAAYCPTAAVSSLAISDSDGLAIMEIGLKAYVNDAGEGEFYLGMV